MNETRNHFTFHLAFYETVSSMKNARDRAAAYDMICRYALFGEPPELDGKSENFALAMRPILPVIRLGLVRSASGRLGGIASKTEANCKQNESKPQAKCKQNASKTEAKCKQNFEEEKREEAPLFPFSFPPDPPIISPYNPPEGKKEEDLASSLLQSSDACAAASPAGPDKPAAPPAILLPLNDGTDFPVTEEKVQEFAELYKAVDIMQELRNMKGWLLSNPKNRKTRSGILRFINAWLSKEQNRGRSNGGAASKQLTGYGTASPSRTFTEEEKLARMRAMVSAGKEGEQ